MGGGGNRGVELQSISVGGGGGWRRFAAEAGRGAVGGGGTLPDFLKKMVGIGAERVSCGVMAQGGGSSGVAAARAR